MSETVKIALFCALALVVGIVLGCVIQKKLAEKAATKVRKMKEAADAAALKAGQVTINGTTTPNTLVKPVATPATMEIVK